MSSRLQTTFLIFALVALFPNPKNKAHAYAADALETEMSTPSHLIKFLTAADFDASISNATDAPWIVFFGAPWCPHCQHFAPIYKAFALQANTKHDTLQMASVNCSTQDSVCSSQNIQGYPTIQIYSNQKFYTMTNSRTIAGLNDFALTFLTKSGQSGPIQHLKSLRNQVPKTPEIPQTPPIYRVQGLVVKGLMFFLLVF
jgi:thiol-disulfide isomerase/thioredoxin